MEEDVTGDFGGVSSLTAGAGFNTVAIGNEAREVRFWGSAAAFSVCSGAFGASVGAVGGSGALEPWNTTEARGCCGGACRVDVGCGAAEVLGTSVCGVNSREALSEADS